MHSHMKAWRLLAAGLGLLVAVGCARDSNVLFDFDEDGSLDEDNCDTANHEVYPGAPDPFGDELDMARLSGRSGP